MRRFRRSEPSLVKWTIGDLIAVVEAGGMLRSSTPPPHAGPTARLSPRRRFCGMILVSRQDTLAEPSVSYGDWSET
jgi:hypothetical protein